MHWLPASYVCQDDYGNVDNSRWRSETACDQHSGDKTLCNHREYCLSKRSRVSRRPSIIWSRCPVTSKVFTVSCYWGNAGSNIMHMWNVCCEQHSLFFLLTFRPVTAKKKALHFMTWCFLSDINYRNGTFSTFINSLIFLLEGFVALRNVVLDTWENVQSETVKFSFFGGRNPDTMSSNSAEHAPTTMTL